MSEADEQIAVVDYCNWKRIPVFHIPNERRCSQAQGLRLKRMGVRSGVPDLCIPVARGGFHALYIEMKSKTGKPTRTQLEWIDLLRSQGCAAEICHGADEAIAAIDRYFSPEK